MKGSILLATADSDVVCRCTAESAVAEGVRSSGISDSVVRSPILTVLAGLFTASGTVKIDDPQSSGCSARWQTSDCCATRSNRKPWSLY